MVMLTVLQGANHLLVPAGGPTGRGGASNACRTAEDTQREALPP